MADNTELASGSGGDTIATDDISGVKFPRSKIVIGADGVNDGDVSSANPLPISGTVDLGATDNAVLDSILSALQGTLTVGSHAVTNAGTFAVQVNGDALTALQAIETAVEGTLTVDGSGVTQPISAASLPLPTGAATAANQSTANTALAAIQTAVQLIDNAISGNEMQVDIVSSAAVPVTDNSGSLTVDAANDGSLVVQIGDGTSLATVRNLAANDALNVAIVDGSGNQVTSFGGSGGTSADDDSAFTAGSGSGTPAMGFFSTDTVDSGDVGVLAMDANRRLLVSIEADNVGIGGGTQYTEDDAAPDNPVGNAMLAERDDALGGLTPAEGDWTHLFANANGALWVKHDGALPITDNSGSITVDNGGTFAVQAAQSGTWNVTNISGTVSLPTGASTAANQSTIIGHLDGVEGLLTTIDADTGTLAGAVAGSEMQVDVVGALPAGTNNIGDVDVLTLPDSVSGPGEPSVDSFASVAISASANTANQQLVAAPGANKQIWVYGFVGSADTGDGSISLQDEDDTALSGVMPVVQNGGFAVSPSGNFSMPWFKVATNKALEIDTVTCGFKGVLSYAVVDVS